MKRTIGSQILRTDAELGFFPIILALQNFWPKPKNNFWLEYFQLSKFQGIPVSDL